MVFVHTSDKWAATRAFINTWLKDKTFYCNYCGLKYNPNDKDSKGDWSPCCNNPQIGRNIDHTKGVIEENKMVRETRKNELGQTDDKSLRYGISLPPTLMRDLNNYFKIQYGQKFLADNGELHKFMKEFPQFTTCKRI